MSGARNRFNTRHSTQQTKKNITIFKQQMTPTDQLEVFFAHLRLLVQQFIGWIRVGELKMRNEEVAVFSTLRPDIHAVADAAGHADEKWQSCKKILELSKLVSLD